MFEGHPRRREKTEKFLSEAQERFHLAEEAESEIRKLWQEDMDFRAGNQWDAQTKKKRTDKGRPCHVVNRMPQFIRQVTNELRQNRPSIQVNPVDDHADVETAEILQGLIRHIEYDSNADVAYDTAAEHAVTAGLGYIRVVTEYCDPKSFDQDIKIRRVRNPLTVMLDPSYQQPDGSDAKWAFVFEDYTEDDFKTKWPKSDLAAMKDWTPEGANAAPWVSKDSCRVAEYFYRTSKTKKLLLLSDGSTELAEDLQKDEEGNYVLPEGLSVKDERETEVQTIQWCKINGIEILEETEWSGDFIPLVPVLGDELEVDGVRILEGIVRHAKDPQRMLNYWASKETETITLAPISPWVGAAGQFEGFEQQYREANREAIAYLEYNPTTVNGQPAPPPQRNVMEPPVAAITRARLQAADDLKAITGIYDAQLGAMSQEQSGVALQRRQSQSQIANFHYIDNLTRAIRHLGRILINLIPRIYDTRRVARTIDETGETKMVTVNGIHEEGGIQKIYDLTTGKYDVTVSVGPSYQTKRQEAVQSMLSLIQADPQVVQIIGDLLVKAMDWPGSQEIADRLRKMLPPQLQEQEGQDKPQIPPQLQAQQQQMAQMVQQLSAEVNKLMDERESKVLELESRERIALIQQKTEIFKTLATIDSKEAVAMFEGDQAQIDRRLALLQVDQPMGQDGQQPTSVQAPTPNGAQPEAQPAALGAAPQIDAGAYTPAHFATGGGTPGLLSESNQ